MVMTMVIMTMADRNDDSDDSEKLMAMVPIPPGTMVPVLPFGRIHEAMTSRNSQVRFLTPVLITLMNLVSLGFSGVSSDVDTSFGSTVKAGLHSWLDFAPRLLL